MQPLRGFSFNAANVFVLRDDLLHPEISGNKWRKLKHNLLEARAMGHDRLLTFGGAFSNHLAAVAAAGKIFNFKTAAFVRGENASPLNPTLTYCRECGMELFFMSRAKYKAYDFGVIDGQWADAYQIPEGGSNCAALEGFTDFVADIKNGMAELPDYICVAAGTGGTSAGIISKLDFEAEVLSFPVLKGGFMEENISKLLSECGQVSRLHWKVMDEYHFGGYAKWNEKLLQFIKMFYQNNDFPLDPIYTGKLFFGVHDLLQKGYFKKDSRILLVHTGGLQGVAGFNRRFLTNLPT